MMSLMQTRHFNYLADTVAPLLGWPGKIQDMADALAATNPRFNKEKFIERATKAWEEANPVEEIDDYIPHDYD